MDGNLPLTIHINARDTCTAKGEVLKYMHKRERLGNKHRAWLGLGGPDGPRVRRVHRRWIIPLYSLGLFLLLRRGRTSCHF